MHYDMEKIASVIYDEEYMGVNLETNTVVYCILDENCVKWIKCNTKTGKSTRHEFSNEQKQKCWNNALRALNR